MNFIDEKINEYVLNHSEKEPDILQELDRSTHVQILNPRMLSGHLQGRVLSMLSKLVSPKQILEIGTYTGYSSICLAEGLQVGGKLTTIDINEELEIFTKSYFKKAGVLDKIDFKIGNALDIIPELKETFDLVFIDADKSNYLNYYQLILPKVNKGGLVLVDNVLWSGKVLEPAKTNDIDTSALQEFNKIIKMDDSVEKVILPIRDGITMIRKK